MFRPPKEVEGKCNAHYTLFKANRYMLISCQLDPGHIGKHEAEFDVDGEPTIARWTYDERDEEKTRD